MIPTTDQTTFLADRLTGIGGSDMGALFNIAPYGCARALAYEKLQVEPDYPREETGPMRRGTVLEAAAAAEYERVTGHTLEVANHQRHPQYHWAVVHIDRWVVVDGVRVATAEIKVPGREMMSRIRRQGISDAYILQAQHSMLVTGAGKCEFMVLDTEKWELLHWTIEADPVIHEAIIDAGTDFWAKVQQKELPEKLPSDSPQCQRCPWRTSCQGEALLPAQEKGELETDPKLLPLVEAYVDAKQLLEEADMLVATAREPLEKAIADRPGVEVPGYRIWFRQQAGSYRLNEAKAMAVIRALEARLAKHEQVKPAKAEDLKQQTAGSRPLRVYAK